MRILLTAFEPFGGSSVNPSQVAVQRLAAPQPGDPPTGLPPGASLATEFLPVVGGPAADAAPARLVAAMEWQRPDVLVCVGETGSRGAICLERIAVNLRDYRIPDNAGVQVHDQAVVPHAPAAYFSTLPLRHMLAALQEEGIPAELSLSAGTFLCNEVMYYALHHAPRVGCRMAGFIHVPRLPSQCAAGEPQMPLQTTLAGLRASLRALTGLAGANA